MKALGSTPEKAETTLSLDRESRRGWQSAMQASMERDSGTGTERFSSMHGFVKQKFTEKALVFVQEFASLSKLPNEQVVGVAAMVFDEMFANGGNTPEKEGAALYEVRNRLLNGETAPAGESTPETTSLETAASVATVYNKPATPDNVPPSSKLGEEERARFMAYGAEGTVNGTGELETRDTSWETLRQSVRAPSAEQEKAQSEQESKEPATTKDANPDQVRAAVQEKIANGATLKEISDFIKGLREMGHGF